jgi:hypothetical protein
LARVCSGRGSDGKESPFVNETHDTRLLSPIVFVILDNAQGVNPDKLDIQVSAHNHRISESRRKFLQRDLTKMKVEPCLRGSYRALFDRAPTMAKRNVRLVESFADLN